MKKIDFENSLDLTYDFGYTRFKEFNKMVPKNMLHLVAYDIAGPSRLRKIAKICEDYGVRVEKSVFECDLSEKDFNDFWNKMKKVIHKDQDAIVAYRVGTCCIKKAKAMGIFDRPTKRLYYIF